MLVQAAGFITLARVEETARGWLARADAQQPASEPDLLLVADALGMATDLVLFTPSASGGTAFDRLARSRGRLGADEAAALDVLRRSELRLESIQADAVGYRSWPGSHPWAMAAMCSSAVARRWTRRGSPLRWVSCVLVDPALATPIAAPRPVYRHVLRHGKPKIPGLNRPPKGEDAAFPFGAAESALDAVAHRWAEIGAAQQDPADVQLIRTQAELGTILDMVVSSAMARDGRHDPLADAYAAIVLIQLETMQRRTQAGSGAGNLDAVADAVDGAIAGGDIPPTVRSVFDDLRRRARCMPLGKAAGRSDAELERLIGLIQALRAKTVEQGCTEQEALAAVEKVAELLDRHGLQLSELDLRRQACAGALPQGKGYHAGFVASPKMLPENAHAVSFTRCKSECGVAPTSRPAADRRGQRHTALRHSASLTSGCR